MSVAAHTSEFGSHSKFVSIGNDHVAAFNPDGSFHSEAYGDPIVIREGYSYRQQPNKTPYIRNGYTLSKDYQRHVHHAQSLGKTVWRESPVVGSGYSYIRSRPKRPNSEARVPPNFDAMGQNLRAEAIVKALNKLRGENAMQLGADLGEVRRTMNMIADPFSRLLRAYRAGRSGRWGSIPNILGMNKRDVLTGKTLANNWLAYQYGWMPLKSTVYSGVEVLREGFGFPSFRRTANVAGTARWKWDQVIPDSADVIRLSGDFRVTCGLSFTVSDSAIASLDAAGLVNPLSIAWELVPFSFVLDWFIPVGNTLSALSATAGLTFVDGYISESRTCFENVDARPFPPIDGGTRRTMLELGKSQTSSFFHARSYLSGFPTPQLYASSNPLSTKRVSNALALLRQLI